MEQINHSEFEEQEQGVMDEPTLKKVVRKGDFPSFFDLVVMLFIVVFSQLVVGAVAVALGLEMPEVTSGEVADIERFIAALVVRGESFAIIYPTSMIVAFGLLLLYVRFRDGEGRIARVSTRGFDPTVILGGLLWMVSMQVVVEP